MSNQKDKRPLTSDDPVEPEVLEQLQSLQSARQRFAENLLSLEQEKIQILAAAKKVDAQRERLFEACIVARGISPQARIEIDAKSGKIFILEEAPKAVKVDA